MTPATISTSAAPLLNHVAAEAGAALMGFRIARGPTTSACAPPTTATASTPTPPA
ncbi:hypothetical protein AB0M22_44465 [Nocardia sp. NPDC051756]|uniref:hypothetical protein n=1 Tax=Nocardia sp. NPDC051756 TaxID=3154751 RepID=UPI0034186163